MRRARSAAVEGGSDPAAPGRGRRRTGVHERKAARRMGRSSRAGLGAVTLNSAALALLMGIFAIVTGRVLGPHDRGIVVIFMTLSSMLMVLGSFGANTFARVHLVSVKKRLPLKEYLGLIGVLATAQFAISLIFGGLAMWATNSLPNFTVLLFLVLYSVLNVVSYLLRDGIYAFGHNGRASRGDPLAAALQLVLVLAIWATWGLTLDRALLVVTVSQACCAIYLLAQFRRVDLPLTVSLSWKSCLLQIRGGLPALITNLGQTFIFRIDRLLLGFLATTTAVGIYSVAVTMTEALLLIPISIGQAMFHRLASGRMRLEAMRRLRLTSLIISMAGAAVPGIPIGGNTITNTSGRGRGDGFLPRGRGVYERRRSLEQRGETHTPWIHFGGHLRSCSDTAVRDERSGTGKCDCLCSYGDCGGDAVASDQPPRRIGVDQGLVME